MLNPEDPSGVLRSSSTPSETASFAFHTAKFVVGVAGDFKD